MKILFLNYEHPQLGNGATNVARHLLNVYREKKNISIDLITTAVDNKEHVEDLGGDVRIHYVPINKNRHTLTQLSLRDLLAYSWKGYKKAKELMQQQKYDYIHAFSGIPCGYMAQRLSRRFSVPYIVSLRGADVPGFSERYEHIYPLIKPFIVSVWRDAVAVVANSKKLRDLALQSAPQQEILIIYNGVDTDVFMPPTINTSRTNDQFVVLTAARQLTRREGIHFAVDAFRQICDLYPRLNAKMIIAGGTGNAEAMLHQRVKDVHLEERVLFAGHLDQKTLIEAYQNADVFVLPSLNEGMSNTVLEALACGLPVIVTRTGGSEIITDGREGFIVERESADAIRVALEHFIKSPEALVTMGAAARALAEKMSWHAVADQHEKLYYEKYNKRN